MEVIGDNEGSKAIVVNASCAFRSEHIDVKLRFIQGLVCVVLVSISNAGM